MRLSFTLSLYIVRQFLASVAIAYGILSLLILLIDALELIRRSHQHDVPFFTVLSMVIFKFPLMGQKIIPFAMLFGTILAYHRLNRHQELVVLRAAGVSVWEFLLPALLAAFALGVAVVVAVNPLSAAMLAKYQTLEEKHLKGKGSFLAVSQSGLWLRQKSVPEGAEQPPVETVIHAEGVSKAEELELSDVTIFVFDASHRFSRRIDAAKAKLLDGYWHLKRVVVTGTDGKAARYPEYFLETTFTVRDIHDSFTAPEAISFWSLGEFIDTLQNSGFSALSHRLYWHATLASPFLYAAMVVIALLFSLNPPRQGHTGLLITGSVLAGFLIYFFTNLASSLGLSGSMPIIVAAWAPVAASVLAGVGLLLHFEDG